MRNAYAVGHDVEVFVAERDTDKIIPVCGRVGGTKEKPIPLEGSKVGTTYQEDGVALELGMTPCLYQEFESNILVCREDAQKLAADKGLRILKGSANKFDAKDLKPFPQAMILGCSSDQLAAQRGEARQPILVESLNNQRFTGGHLHFSYPIGGSRTDRRNANGVPTWAIVDMLDAFALAFYHYHSINQQGNRFPFYGLPGLYRDKPYGLEYRTPSNAWFWHKDAHTSTFLYTCAQVVQSCNELSATKVHDFYSRINMERVRDLLDLTAFATCADRIYNDAAGTLHSVQEVKDEMLGQLGELRE